MSVIKVKKLSDNAKIPEKGSPGAAGYDLYSAEASTIPPGKRSLIKTDIIIECESYYNFYFRVAPRSGLALKGIDIGAGVVDKDYRGNIGVIVINNSDKDFDVKVGDRIAQLIPEQILETSITEVSSVDQTERGANGFGSTGK